MKRFLSFSLHQNDFANYFQNAAIYLFKYFVSQIMIIPRNDTFQ